MKPNLSIVYHVNKEDGVVTALFRNKSVNLYSYLNRYSPVSTPNVDINVSGMDLSSYIGMAKCMPNDKFDENIGKKIARRRLLRSFYIDFDILLQEVEKQLDMAKKGISMRRKTIAEKKAKMLEELNEFYAFIDALSKKEEEKKEAAAK